MTETFYDTLGVSTDATTEEIEAAYREAIKRVHPDVSDDVDAGERTKRLNRAKRVLTDDRERARYDRLGHARYTDPDPSGSSASEDANDVDSDSSAGQSGSEGSAATEPGGRRRARSDWSERADDHTRTDRSTAGESTWRGSRQHGRRSGPGETSGESGRRRRERQGRERGRSARRSADASGTTRSRADSRGPSWQSNGTDAGGSSPSARRQAAAGATDGPNVDWSWNAWEATGAWAVRQGADGRRRLRLSRLFPLDESLILLVSTFVLYPFFVAATLFPAFPVVARLAVGVCTLLTFAYLLSIPEAAILVFGLWSVVVSILLVAVPGLGVFSLAGVVGLTATWVPLGLSVLTFTLVRS